MKRIEEVGSRLGVERTCDAFGIARSSFYRHRQPGRETRGRRSPRALSADERGSVLGLLHEERFVDQSPAQVVSRLLDEGVYHCSERTMYRILSENGEVRERRDQLSRPSYERPELLATRPNELWSWDITKLKGPVKWTYYYLYVVLDVYSRYVVGWMVAPRESAILARRLFEETCRRQGIRREELTVHADRGSSMRSKAVAMLLSDLGVTKSHSRPHVSNDNPYSEAQFKTLKYRPEFPKRFGSIEDARLFCVNFFRWYNTEHYHSGVGLMTPFDVHSGRAGEKRRRRAAVLKRAYAAHPERFVRGVPRPAELPKEVWINKPVGSEAAKDAENGPMNMSPEDEIVPSRPADEAESERIEKIAAALP